MTDQHTTAAAEDTLGRPAGTDHGDAAYWARVRRIVAQAPPLTDLQRARLRAAFHQPADHKEKAA
ncbi:hypothetical protein [Streptomyces laculatispora]|uniref:hypothetical protein n=1 Tax=Streptomyces laculatispora TaxID=887464 RepID=UPI001A94382D|nr:hypothetical protein [Streptomyces laculatispora]MBO0917507.1 hypothetical protein [Streptomyces laculatispora]